MTVAEDRVARLRQALQQRFSPEQLLITDESHLHAGHAGARSGRGHFHVRVVASTFIGMPLIQRHRAIYEAAGELMQTDIHALGIEALAPAEAGC